MPGAAYCGLRHSESDGYFVKRSRIGLTPVATPYRPAGTESQNASERAVTGLQTNILTYWNGEVPWVSARDVSRCGEAFLVSTERTITK